MICRIERTHTLLKSNLVGTKLTRVIEEGKQAALQMRQALVHAQKQNVPSGLQFSLSDDLAQVVDGRKSLGVIATVVPPRNNAGQDSLRSMGDSSVTSGTSDKEAPPSIHLNGTSFEDVDIVQDLETLFAIDNKYEHSLKPFLNDVKQYSAKFKMSVASKKQKDEEKVKPVNKSVLFQAQQRKSSTLRPSSESNVIKPLQQKITTRLSKSAREEARKGQKLRQDNVCLNNVGFLTNATFEEQGPERRAPVNESENVRSTVVRYHELDFVKEITALTDDAGDIDAVGDSMTSFVPAPMPRLRSANSQASVGSSSISSITYKPSYANASRPVYISASEIGQSKSYFKYIARFHTKKHPDETDLCRLSGVACLDSGHVVVTDINHLHVMLFGPDYHFLDSLDVPSPSGIAVNDVHADVVVVTLFHNRKILFIKVHENYLERLHELHVRCSESLYDVACRSNTSYVLCGAGDVHVIDVEGTQTSIVAAGTRTGEARHLEVSADQTHIIVSGDARVICLDSQGKKTLF